MKKLILYPILLVFALAFDACDKDNEKQFNTLKITEGEFEGYEHEFSPNLGFWSVANETTWYVHLVLGDDNNMASGGENIMSMVFYRTGAPQVTFPSAEGQWIEFGINIDGLVYHFRHESAVLTIYSIDETHFEGLLTGQFQEVCIKSMKINISMEISIPMQQI